MSYGSSAFGVEEFGGDHDAPITTSTLPIPCLEWEPVVGSGNWVNVTNELRDNSVSINRGKGSETDQFRSGTMQVTMDNRGRHWDPEFALQGLVLDGTSGCYASAPDSVALSITGDIEIIVKVLGVDWTPAAVSNLVAKWTATGNQRAYRAAIDTTGKLHFAFSDDGSTIRSQVSSVATGFADGSTNWIKISRVASTGIVTYSTSSDGVTYTQLGTATALNAGLAILDTTAVLEIGSQDLGTNNRLTGTVYYVEVRNAVGGTALASPNFAAITPWHGDPGRVTTASDGINTWTINGTGKIIGTPWSGNLRPNRRLRFSETFNGTTYPLFTGYIDRFEQTYDYPNEAVTQITATDAFKLLARATLPGGVFQAEIEADNPVAWWKLDESTSSQVVYDSVGNNHLTLNGDPLLGATQIVARDSGTAAGVDDTADGFQRSGRVLSAAPLTLEAVIQIDLATSGNEMVLLAQVSYVGGTGAVIGLQRTGGSAAYPVMEFAGVPGGGIRINNISLDIWDGAPHHIVGTASASGSLSLYCDGVLVATGATPAGAFEATGTILILGGSLGSTAVVGLDEGTIAHCVMYATELSAARVLAHYNAMLWSSFDDAFAPVTQDRTRGEWAGDSAAQRINHILDTIDLPTSLRDASMGVGSATYTNSGTVAGFSNVEISNDTGTFNLDYLQASIGQLVTGPGVPAGTYVTSVTLNGALTWYDVGTSQPSTGTFSVLPYVINYVDGSVMQATDLSGSLLTYAQKVEETDGGRFFVSAAGLVIYRSRRETWRPPFNLVTYTLGDLSPEIPYKDISLFLDESTIVNQARVARVDGVLQISKDVASITEFSQRNEDHTDLLHSSDLESLDHATFITNQFSDPVSKFPQIVISPRRSPSTMYPMVLGLEIGTRLTVRRRPQGVGSAIDKEVIVEGISHHVGQKMHEVTLFVSELDALKVWILDDTTSSVLDSTTRLGW